MNKARKILFILFSIVILPVIIFSVYQISTSNENERVIRDIYTKQLDAILYSVNQYSEDVVSSWQSRIMKVSNESLTPEELVASVLKFIKENPSLKSVYMADSSFNILWNLPGKINSEKLKTFLNQNKEKVNNLYLLKKKGYNKTEPAGGKPGEIESTILFLSDNKICGVAVDNEFFIKNILQPKLQEVSQGEFILSVFDSQTKEIIYSTDTSQEAEQHKSLWLLPGFSLGISVKGTSIQDIAARRILTNIVLVLILAALLIAGNWFAYRNMKKEIELAQIKSDFVSNVSHELRTPLSLINMFAETLELDRVRSEDKKKEYYSIISNETNRLSRIVNKILNFSKMEAGKKTYNFNKVAVNEIVENTVNTYKFHLHNSGFTIRLEKGENIPLIYADTEAVSEALINLIDNAVKYSNEKKEISIKTGVEPGNVFIQVDDKGIGISREDQKKIFDKFFRVSSGLVHNVKGTGLGLTIIKHIMDAHNGEISLNSEYGKGSSFRLKFKINP